jgi:hypothetical protein
MCIYIDRFALDPAITTVNPALAPTTAWNL